MESHTIPVILHMTVSVKSYVVMCLPSGKDMVKLLEVNCVRFNIGELLRAMDLKRFLAFSLTMTGSKLNLV